MKKTVFTAFFAALVLFAVTTAYAQTAAELNNSGAAFYKSGNYDAAIADFTKAIKLDSKDADYYAWRGLSYSQKRDWNRAISDFTQAIKLEPKNALYYSWRGDANTFKGDLKGTVSDYNRAISDYSEAIRLGLDNPRFAYLNRGNAYNRKKDYDKAISDYNEAIHLEPNFADAYTSRAYAYFAKGDYAKSHTDLDKTLQLNPNPTEETNYLTAELRKKGYTVQTAQERQTAIARQQAAEAERNRPLRDDDFYVKQNPDNSIIITGFKLSDRDVVIPSTLYGLKVTIIGARAFEKCKIRSVVIPDTVVTIESGAFINVSSGGEYPGPAEYATLTKVTIGKGVRTIGRLAFYGQKNLTEITIPDSVTQIDDYAFAYCGLTSVTFGRGLQTINNSAFRDNNLTSVTIPASVKEIDAYAFASNKIQSVSIGGSNISGNDFIFRDNYNIISRVTLPANLDGFEYCFEESLRNFYASQGRTAGTYVKNGPIWTRQ
jgi:tetratricopeptide (TPR) repeat protein